MNLAIVIAGCLLPAAVWLLVPLHDAAVRFLDALFGLAEAYITFWAVTCLVRED